MKLCHFLLASCFVMPAAYAETTKPVSNWTCQEFLGVEGDFQPKVVYWATAKVKSGKPGSIVDIDGTEKIIPIVIDDCRKTPGSSFMGKLKDAWRALETEAKKVKGKL